MGQNQSGMGFPGGEDGKKKKPEKKKWQPPAPPTRVGKKVKKKGMDGANRLPNVTPASKCMLRKLKLERVKDWLLMEEEFVANQERIKPHTERAEEEKSKLDDLRGSPMSVGNLEEIIDDKCVPSHRTRDEDDLDASASAHGPDLENARDPPFLPPRACRSSVAASRATTHPRSHPFSSSPPISISHAIVSSSVGPEYYVNIMSFVDKSQLEPGCAVLLHNKGLSIVGVLADDVDPMVSVMKVDKAPLESYADVGGLEDQIQEIKEAVELPLTHPELYEDIGIKPPKGVILYGEPGTGKTLLAKAVANSTSASFLRVVGSELIQKYLGDGPKLVRELFRVAEDMSPSIVFIDEIDAVGSKRYDSNSGGEKEIQRTMIELLTQMDGFEARGDVKVIMATNKIESLDPALLRPGRIDRKIEFPLPDVKTKRHIFGIHTGRMNLADDVQLEEFVMAKDELSGADIKALCTEAGLLALRERRMQVTHADFSKAKEKVLYKKREGAPEGMFM